jgi:hypothetical protein
MYCNTNMYRSLYHLYAIRHWFICRHPDSTVSEDAEIEPRTVATLALTRSNYSARSLPHVYTGII